MGDMKVLEGSLDNADKQAVGVQEPVVMLAVRFYPKTGAMDISCPEDWIMAGALLGVLKQRVSNIYYRQVTINDPPVKKGFLKKVGGIFVPNTVKP